MACQSSQLTRIALALWLVRRTGKCSSTTDSKIRARQDPALLTGMFFMRELESNRDAVVSDEGRVNEISSLASLRSRGPGLRSKSSNERRRILGRGGRRRFEALPVEKGEDRRGTEPGDPQGYVRRGFRPLLRGRCDPRAGALPRRSAGARTRHAVLPAVEPAGERLSNRRIEGGRQENETEQGSKTLLHYGSL